MSYIKKAGSGGGDTYTLRAAQAGSDVDIQLDATAGADSSVQLKAGTNITLTESSDTIAIDAAGISGITVQDEGTPLSTLATTLNFAGAGVVASGTGATKTITVAGGGGGSGGGIEVSVTDDDVINTSSSLNQRFAVHRVCGWGQLGQGSGGFSNQDSPVFRPFIAPFTGTLAEIGLECTTADATATTRYIIGFYDDADGAPDTLVGNTTFAMPLTSTGQLFASGGALSNISFIRNKQYWYAMVRNNQTNQLACRATNNSQMNWVGPSGGVGVFQNQQPSLQLTSSLNALPSTVTQSNLFPTFQAPAQMTIRKT